MAKGTCKSQLKSIKSFFCLQIFFETMANPIFTLVTIVQKFFNTLLDKTNLLLLLLIERFKIYQVVRQDKYAIIAENIPFNSPQIKYHGIFSHFESIEYLINYQLKYFPLAVLQFHFYFPIFHRNESSSIFETISNNARFTDRSESKPIQEIK